MNCRDIEPLLLAERDGVLTKCQCASLDQHVTSCFTCQQLRIQVGNAMTAFRTEAASTPLPDVEVEWQMLRARLHDQSAEKQTKRKLAPVIWLSAPLAAAAALAFAYFSPRSEVAKAIGDTASSNPEIAQAEYVYAGDAEASTLVYVDKESGWLVVWATDHDTVTKS